MPRIHHFQHDARQRTAIRWRSLSLMRLLLLLLTSMLMATTIVDAVETTLVADLESEYGFYEGFAPAEDPSLEDVTGFLCEANKYLTSYYKNLTNSDAITAQFRYIDWTYDQTAEFEFKMSFTSEVSTTDGSDLSLDNNELAADFKMPAASFLQQYIYLAEPDDNVFHELNKLQFAITTRDPTEPPPANGTYAIDVVSCDIPPDMTLGNNETSAPTSESGSTTEAPTVAGGGFGDGGSTTETPTAGTGGGDGATTESPTVAPGVNDGGGGGETTTAPSISPNDGGGGGDGGSSTTESPTAGDGGEGTGGGTGTETDTPNSAIDGGTDGGSEPTTDAPDNSGNDGGTGGETGTTTDAPNNSGNDGGSGTATEAPDNSGNDGGSGGGTTTPAPSPTASISGDSGEGTGERTPAPTTSISGDSGEGTGGRTDAPSSTPATGPGDSGGTPASGGGDSGGGTTTASPTANGDASSGGTTTEEPGAGDNTTTINGSGETTPSPTTVDGADNEGAGEPTAAPTTFASWNISGNISFTEAPTPIYGNAGNDTNFTSGVDCSNSSNIFQHCDDQTKAPAPSALIPVEPTNINMFPTAAPANKVSINSDFVVSNLDMITRPDVINSTGLLRSWLVFAPELVANNAYTTAAQAQRWLRWNRRLAVSFRPDTAFIHQIYLISCGDPEIHREGLTCHQVHASYDVDVTDDEDKGAVRDYYRDATNKAIGDGSYQDVLDSQYQRDNELGIPVNRLYIGVLPKESGLAGWAIFLIVLFLLLLLCCCLAAFFMLRKGEEGDKDYSEAFVCDFLVPKGDFGGASPPESSEKVVDEEEARLVKNIEEEAEVIEEDFDSAHEEENDDEVWEDDAEDEEEKLLAIAAGEETLLLTQDSPKSDENGSESGQDQNNTPLLIGSDTSSVTSSDDNEAAADDIDPTSQDEEGEEKVALLINDGDDDDDGNDHQDNNDANVAALEEDKNGDPQENDDGGVAALEEDKSGDQQENDAPESAEPDNDADGAIAAVGGETNDDDDWKDNSEENVAAAVDGETNDDDDWNDDSEDNADVAAAAAVSGEANNNDDDDWNDESEASDDAEGKRSYLATEMPRVDENGNPDQKGGAQQGFLIRGMSDREIQEEMCKRGQFADDKGMSPSFATLESEGGWSDADGDSSVESDWSDEGPSALSM